MRPEIHAVCHKFCIFIYLKKKLWCKLFPLHFWHLLLFPKHIIVFVPVLWNTPGLHRQYLWANASIMRSIFWASPGSLKLHRNCLRAWTRFRSVNSCNSRKACSTAMLKSSLHHTHTPTEGGVNTTRTGSRSAAALFSSLSWQLTELDEMWWIRWKQMIWMDELIMHHKLIYINKIIYK